MWNLNLLFILLLFICVSISLAKKSGTSRAHQNDQSKSALKINSINDKLDEAPTIKLTDKNVNHYILDGHRDYHAVLMLTATDPKYKCSICQRAKSTLEDLATNYNSQYYFNTSESNVRIAFFVAEVEDAQNLFAELRLDSVPHTYILPPSSSKILKSKLTSLEVDPKAFLEGLSNAILVIEGTTKVPIKIVYDSGLVLLGAFFVVSFLALFSSLVSHDTLSSLLIYQSTTLWTVFSLICFGVGVSGTVFCIIRSAPLFGYNRMGDLSIFAAQGRDQFYLEGFIVAIMTLTISVSFYLVYFCSKLRFPLLRHFLTIVLMSILMAVSCQLWHAYVTKTPWYSLKDTLPSYVWQYFVSSVKKSTGVIKRLIRLSEIWLFETKDMKGFGKKFEGLLIDFLKRQMKK